MKLPPEEAERRKKLRNIATSERRRLEKAAYKAIHGCNPPTSETRKEQMKLYARVKREKEKALRPPKIPKPVKSPKPAKPTKLIKTVKPKTMPVAKKPKAQARVFKTRDTTQGKVKIRIDHRTEVYVTPGQDIDQVKARYLNRRL